ncbi:amidohydrolase family protein [Nonomuraea endophytica]|uniref:Aminocarboxymuconate-semialdehyde decarboxylase n=1 Tax=Nonomuraea endophytica TaxID=714136 RepID=A0A7W8AEZ4_9ACTN|nr:amidohydrolase family protein [Nonomuraea endophytica]MBB5084883.1 aminocarboxymuconate-semialdehyde decarboxylase [Nonomuraea endophytica]
MRVDFHAHLWTDDYLDLLDSYGRAATATQRGTGAGTSPAEMSARFSLMDAAGIGLQVLSATPQAADFADPAHALTAARHVNDLYAETVRRWPGRFAMLAALPLPHADLASAELARAMDDLGAAGVAINSSALGHTSLLPVYAELDRRGAVLFVHPAGEFAADPRLRWAVGAPVEDTVAAMRLIVDGVPLRYPGMRIVVPHLGGALAMLTERADHQVSGLAEPPSVTARRMFYDTVSHGHAPALRAAAQTFGADRLVLGTDFPFLKGELFTGAVSYLAEALNPQEVEQVTRRTPSSLLTRG